MNESNKTKVVDMKLVGFRITRILTDYKVCLPKTNTMYHMHTLGAFICKHVVHSVGFRKVLVLCRHTYAQKSSRALDRTLIPSS